MATAIHPFNKLQLGIESAKGTLVAATRVIQCDGAHREQAERYRSARPQGVRATAGGAGSTLMHATDLLVETEATAEEILWPLLTGVKGAVTPTGAGNAKTWVFTPEVTTAIPTLDSATAEYAMADGVTNHYYRESGYAMTRSFKLGWAFNQIATLGWSMFARRAQTGTPTGSLVVYSSREPLVSNLLALYLDTSWAGLGGTQVVTIVRSAEFECITGIEADHTLDARSDLDLTIHKASSIGAKLAVVLEFNATAATLFANYRANDVVYIRLKNTGSAIAGGGNKTIQIDGAYRFVEDPTFAADGDQMLMSASLEAVYDATGTKILEFTAINALAAVA